ncbi:hypothetical protein QFC20_006172 [Naganishia adeliensis]|uniref:Uncharacterized protein n=1 Tax=Naganishia adeliensis TaxID=92952 RepID=A0ACC2VF06_9TREE|nr:hypothetical protein QFC20_006172 [Naganishia adeliensis]
MRSSFDFSAGNIPEIIPQHWKDYLEASKGKKYQPKAKQEMPDQATTSGKKKQNPPPASADTLHLSHSTPTSDEDMSSEEDTSSHEDTSSATAHTSPESGPLPRGVQPYPRRMRFVVGSASRNRHPTIRQNTLAERAEIHRAATVLCEMMNGHPYTRPGFNAGISPPSTSGSHSAAEPAANEPAANAEAGPGPSTMAKRAIAKRVSFAHGTK